MVTKLELLQMQHEAALDTIADLKREVEITRAGAEQKAAKSKKTAKLQRIRNAILLVLVAALKTRLRSEEVSNAEKDKKILRLEHDLQSANRTLTRSEPAS